MKIGSKKELNKKEQVSSIGVKEIKNEKNNVNILWIVISVCILLIAVGIFFAIRKGDIKFIQKNKNVVVKSEETSVPENVYVEEVSDEAEVSFLSKEDVKIQVLNGTGVSGLAGSVKVDIEELGYSNIDVDNADASNFTTTIVNYTSDVSEATLDEITSVLKERFEEVVAETSQDEENMPHNIKIITGKLLTE